MVNTAETCSIHIDDINPLNAELNPICHLLALVGVHNILHVSGVRFNRICCGRWQHVCQFV